MKDSFGANKHISCFAHATNLVAHDAINFPEALELSLKINKIITFFKHSVIAADELRKVSKLKLVQAIDTHWNSTFEMLQRFVQMSKEVGTILLNKPDSPPMLTAVEIQLANEIIEIL